MYVKKMKMVEHLHRLNWQKRIGGRKFRVYSMFNCSNTNLWNGKDFMPYLG